MRGKWFLIVFYAEFPFTIKQYAGKALTQNPRYVELISLMLLRAQKLN